MVPRFMIGVGASCGLLLATAVAAQDALMSLSKNPFSQPEILNAPPPLPPAPVKVVLPPEEIRLELTATMVSETAPMVVVDGELLTIGEKIEGFKLIAVKEGVAVFRRGGKNYSFEIESGERQ